MSKVPFSSEGEGPFSHGDHAEKTGSKPQYIQPNYIIIDDRKESRQHGGDPFDRRQSIHFGETGEKNSPQASTSLRFLCVLGLVFCLVFGFGILLWSIVLTLFALLTFFQNHQLNQSVRTFWKLYLNTMIAGFGFALGVLSPPLGLGLLVLYFSLTGESFDSQLLRKIIRRSFKNL